MPTTIGVCHAQQANHDYINMSDAEQQHLQLHKMAGQHVEEWQ